MNFEEKIRKYFLFFFGDKKRKISEKSINFRQKPEIFLKVYGDSGETPVE